jgi:galactonate dehydratase
MKIARIESFILGTGSSKDLLFCRVETEDGLHDWGEATSRPARKLSSPSASRRWRRM